jgi:hypothetical protein
MRYKLARADTLTCDRTRLLPIALAAMISRSMARSEAGVYRAVAVVEHHPCATMRGRRKKSLNPATVRVLPPPHAHLHLRARSDDPT